MISKRKLLAPLLVLAFIVPIVTADVIYIYTGTINVTTTASPISFQIGPNGQVPINPSAPSKGYYVNVITSKNSNSFTAYLNITNSTYDYFYQAVTMTVSQTTNLYVANVLYTYSSSSNPINNMWIIIYGPTSASSPSTYVLKIVNNGQAATPNSVLPLSPGTYYISFYVQPNTPLPLPSANSVATITVQFGNNIPASSSIPLPPVS